MARRKWKIAPRRTTLGRMQTKSGAFCSNETGKSPEPRLDALHATKEIRGLRKSWLGREDSNLRMAESKSAFFYLKTIAYT
jgi:hypothetical protein